jgi:hypothetical protein
MLRGQVAVFLSCSERFKQAVAWPVRDALAEQKLRAIIVTDEPCLPSTGGDHETKVESYLGACSAFVALCTADHKLSDGTMYTRANIIDEIQLASGRPHLRDRSQILTSPGVLLPSSITSTYDGLDPARPALAADIVLQQLAEWGVAACPAGPPSPRQVTDAEAAADIAVLFAELPPADHTEARRRVYELLRDRDEARRRWIARALHREVMDAGDEARQRAAVSLLDATSKLDASLVSIEMLEMLATHPGYVPRSCAANLLLDRAIVAPLDVPVEMLGRLATPHREDWYVMAPAIAAVKELVLKRRDAYMIFESLGASPEPQDRYAVAEALLDVAGVKPPAVAKDLVERLAGDPDLLVAGKAREVMAAIEHVTDLQRAECYGHFGA